MPRRQFKPNPEIKGDALYNEVVVQKFINCLMKRGKKTVAQKIFYGTMDIIESKEKDNPLVIFKKALENVKPQLEVKSKRVGGSTYQVPMEVTHTRQNALAIRWLIQYSRKRHEKGMKNKLYGELMDAYHNRGATIKKKEETHRMAEANKTFAHYRG